MTCFRPDSIWTGPDLTSASCDWRWNTGNTVLVDGDWDPEDTRRACSRHVSLYLGIAMKPVLLAPIREKRQSSVMYDAFLTRQWN